MMAQFKSTLNEEEKAFARAMLLALEAFTEDRPTMPIQYVISFLRVAAEEGHGSVEYAKRAGMSPSVMTRHLLDIGDRNRSKEEGFGWITQERDMYDLRRHAAKVTPVGRTLLHKAMTAIKTFRGRW